MKCAGIKEILSQYIDGMLGDRERAALEEHLSTCENCREELDSLRALVQELGALEPVKAPADFLGKIHERLAQPSLFKRLFHKLFVRFPIKIPLQLAAAVAAAFLVFSVVTLQREEKEMVQMTKMSPSKEGTEKAQFDRVAPAPKGEQQNPAGISQDSLKKRSHETREVVELVLLVEPGGRSGLNERAVSLKATPATEEEVREERTDSTPRRKAMTRKAPARSAMEEERFVEGAGSTAPQVSRGNGWKDETAIPSSPVDNISSALEKLVVQNKGNVLRVAYDSVSGRLDSVVAEIPGTQYEPFLRELAYLASLRVLSPAPSDKVPEKVRVRIRFLSSEEGRSGPKW